MSSETTVSARLVASILTDNGHAVSSPDDGDLDDVELERWNVCVEIADRVEAPLRVENALLRQSLDADGALRQVRSPHRPDTPRRWMP